MSIDFLLDLERAIENGREIYACLSGSRTNWEISESLEAITKSARRLAMNRKSPVSVMRLIPAHDLAQGAQILVPTKLGQGNNSRGPVDIVWSVVETKEAAETLRDVSQGPSPYFQLEEADVIKPA